MTDSNEVVCSELHKANNGLRLHGTGQVPQKNSSTAGRKGLIKSTRSWGRGLRKQTGTKAVTNPWLKNSQPRSSTKTRWLKQTAAVGAVCPSHICCVFATLAQGLPPGEPGTGCPSLHTEPKVGHKKNQENHDPFSVLVGAGMSEKEREREESRTKSKQGPCV